MFLSVEYVEAGKMHFTDHPASRQAALIDVALPYPSTTPPCQHQEADAGASVCPMGAPSAILQSWSLAFGSDTGGQSLWTVVPST